MRVIQTIAITSAIVAGVTSFALLSAARIAAQPSPPASPVDAVCGVFC
jgi:hypothetical protein